MIKYDLSFMKLNKSKGTKKIKSNTFIDLITGIVNISYLWNLYTLKIRSLITNFHYNPLLMELYLKS